MQCWVFELLRAEPSHQTISQSLFQFIAWVPMHPAFLHTLHSQSAEYVLQFSDHCLGHHAVQATRTNADPHQSFFHFSYPPLTSHLSKPLKPCILAAAFQLTVQSFKHILTLLYSHKNYHTFNHAAVIKAASEPRDPACSAPFKLLRIQHPNL